MCFKSANHMHEDGADCRHEGYGSGRQAHPGYSAAYCQGLFQPLNAFLHRGADSAGVTARGLFNQRLLSRAARSAAFKLWFARPFAWSVHIV